MRCEPTPSGLAGRRGSRGRTSWSFSSPLAPRPVRVFCQAGTCAGETVPGHLGRQDEPHCGGAPDGGPGKPSLAPAAQGTFRCH
jgi:hypothetical protein